MTPEELEQAMRQFEANGGMVEVVQGFEGVAAYRGHVPKKPKAAKPPKEYPPELVERLRSFIDKGVYAASRAIGKKPETLNRIAERYGIMFRTNTAANVADRWADRVKLIPQIVALNKKGLSQAKICLVLGITRIVLRGIAERHGININSRAK